MSPDGQWFYVNETMARRVSRFRLVDGPRLVDREVVWQFEGGGVFPDGLGFDVDGGVYVVSVVSNSIFRIHDGRLETVLKDCDDLVIQDVEEAFKQDRLSRAEIDVGRRWSMRNCTSVAFGGADRRTMYIGSLFGTGLATLKCKHMGAMPSHWDFGSTVLDSYHSFGPRLRQPTALGGKAAGGGAFSSDRSGRTAVVWLHEADAGRGRTAADRVGPLRP